MSDILDKIEALKQLAEQEKENARKEAEEKARKEAELKKLQEKKEAKEREVQEEIKRFKEGKVSTDISEYERCLKAGFKPTPESMHPASYLKHYNIGDIVNRTENNIYGRMEHPCFPEIIKLASEYGMPKEQFNELFDFAMSPEVVDALVEAGADINKFPMENMMICYALATGKETFYTRSGTYNDEDYYCNPKDEVANDIAKTVRKVLEHGFDPKEVAKILSEDNNTSKLMKDCLDEIEKQVIYEREQAKLIEEGKVSGVLGYEDRLKKIEKSSLVMHYKEDEEIVVPFSTLRKDGGIVMANTPETKEKVQTYLKEHKLAVKTALHINRFVQELQNEGISATVCSQEELREKYGEDAGKMTPGKLEVRVPKDKIQKVAKLKEGDIYQVSENSSTLAKVNKGGVFVSAKGAIEEGASNVVVENVKSASVSTKDRDM